MKILIAEDEPIPRQLLQFQLEQWGHTVISAGNGRQAWELLQTHDCQLLITDWDMPEMTGIDLIRKIREAERAGYVYVILLTSKSERASVVTGLTTGADDYLAKPVDKNELKARLQSGQRIIAMEQQLAQQNRTLADANSKMKRDLHAAAQIQQAFLPSRSLNIPDVGVAWHYSPCTELAGDMLNVLRLDEHHVGVYVLDVSGHGVQAALLAVSACRALSNQQDPSSVLWERQGNSLDYQLRAPAAVLRELNSRMTVPSLSEQYFTLFYGILNRLTGEFRYSVAGHPSPAHVSANGDVTFLPGDGLPVGIAETDYDEQRLLLTPGERLVLYSDGVTESMNAAAVLFGNARLRHSLQTSSDQPLETVVATLLADVQTWRGTAPANDDVSLLILEYEPVKREIANSQWSGGSPMQTELTPEMPHAANLVADRIPHIPREHETWGIATQQRA